MVESTQHKHLVTKLEDLVKSRLSLDQVEVVGGEWPPRAIRGQRPDVYGAANGLEIIGEAETSESIGTTQATGEMATFLHYVKNAYKDAIFLLAVPADAQDKAKKMLRIIDSNWAQYVEIVS